MQKTSFPKEKMRILLLEGVHPRAAEVFAEAEYAAEIRPDALSPAELIEELRGVHLLGIRSKTQLTSEVLQAADALLAVGCFCIGTDQADLDTAMRRGVPVFNAPFSNTRSVAELTMANIVMLARKAVQRSLELHGGVWRKSAEGCVEIRGKTLGIIGYGHIGQQIGLLAEAFGMRILFYDIIKKLPLGNAVQIDFQEALLRAADFVTLHVPDTPLTRGMIGAAEIAQMKPGGFLLNLSRGTVVDLSAERKALLEGRLAGAAADVYPTEPRSGSEPFRSELQGLENVILTPHIGGSTEEAQRNIGEEVASALIRFTDTGSTTGAVNFPQVELPMLRDSHRVLNIHRNVPGVLHEINRIMADTGVNIDSQYLSTWRDVGYLIMDVDRSASREIKQRIDALDNTIRTRLLF
jgi:D-3-phosphoglycerate dehydrogenase / 2-oxoglutarate reductase